MPVQFSIRFSSNLYLLVLLVTGILLVVAHTVLNYVDYTRWEVPWLVLQLFELDEENNLPTWFSSFLLLNCAFVLWSHSQGEGVTNHLYWRLLALGFLLLSMDEVAGLHETFHTAIDDNWTIYGAVLVVIAGLAFTPFLMSLERSIAVWFLISGAVYLAGALGVEWLSRDMDVEDFNYTLAVATEEGLEMLGAWLFLRVNVLYDPRTVLSGTSQQLAED